MWMDVDVDEDGLGIGRPEEHFSVPVTALEVETRRDKTRQDLT